MPTILLVDDSSSDRILAAGLLRKGTDWSVVDVPDGHDALMQLANQEIDVVVTDLVMPRMNGRQLVEAISVRHPEIPVIIMTSRGNEQIAVRALELGAASYVTKKRLAESLVETVEQTLAVSRQKRAHSRVMERLVTQRMCFELRNDRELIPPLVNYLKKSIESLGICRGAELRNLASAFEEALLNAYYHGNLEANTAPLGNDRDDYVRTAEQRASQQPWCDRRMFVEAELSPEQATVRIRDEGPGFDVASLKQDGSEGDFGGRRARGLSLFKQHCDEYSFNESGNELTLVRKRGGSSRETPDDQSRN